MNPFLLARRAVLLHWRASLAAALGVAVAAAVGGGALIMEPSVRASLADLVRARLGRTDFVVRAPAFVREEFVDRLSHAPAFAAGYEASPLIALEGGVSAGARDARSHAARIYGVPDGFWAFHGRDVPGLDPTGAYLSATLARDLGVRPGDAIVVRLEHRAAVPPDSLFGRKDDVDRAVRLTVTGVLDAADLGDFSLRPRQGPVRAVFTPLARLQRALDRRGQVNTVLVAAKDGADRSPRAAGTIAALAAQTAAPADVGVLETLEPASGTIVVGRASGIVDDALARAAEQAAADLDLPARPVEAYVATSIRAGDRQIPYSMVAALDLDAVAPGPIAPAGGPGTPGAGAPETNDQSLLEDPPVVLNDWAARELGASEGDTLWLSYYLWEPEGSLRTEMARFRLAAVVPIRGTAADPRLVPYLAGITDADRVSDWDPPFPIDRAEVRPEDDAYWARYGATPKAFVPLDTGRRLWGSRYGSLTSVRVLAGTLDFERTAARYRERLRARLGPGVLGLATRAVAADDLAAARGATDFGPLFLLWALPLVVSALVVTAAAFRAGLDGRARELGGLAAAGFSSREIGALLWHEAALIAGAGALGGLAGAPLVAALLTRALDTRWRGAVDTSAMAVHLTPAALGLAAAGALAVAVVGTGVLHLVGRRVALAPPARLLAGETAPDPLARPGPPSLVAALSVALAAGLAGLGLTAVALARLVPLVTSFFAVGALALAASLGYFAFWLLRRDHHLIEGVGWSAVAWVGCRGAARRPWRSLRVVTVLALTAFAVVAADAFRHGADPNALADEPGTGGYPLIAESVVPIVHDLNTVTGRRAVGFELPPELPISAARFTCLRVHPGDDVSRRSLYRPPDPRILGVGRDFETSDRFVFGATLARTPDEQAHPWTLLDRAPADGAVPVVADARSMADVLHVSVGGTMTIQDSAGRPVTLRFVAALRGSVFQDAVLMADRDFQRLFPDEPGYRAFLIDVEPRWAPALADRLETALADFVVTATSTPARLASFRAVADTRLGVLQALTAWALVLGVFAIGALAVRNARERRGELAALEAAGFTRGDLTVLVAAEHALLVGVGLGIGVACGLLATAPAFLSDGGTLPTERLLATLLWAALVGVAAGTIPALVRSR